MSTSDRICETCVYCSFAGNCDRYNKPLISIEQPACDTYEIHPLLAENAKLRELVRDMYKAFMHGNCYRWCEFKEPCNYITDGKCQWYDRMRELGVEV